MDLNTLDVLMRKDVVLNGVLVRVLEIAQVTTFGLFASRRSAFTVLLSAVHFALLLLGAGILEPNLDDAFWQSNLATESFAFGHRRRLVIREERFHDAHLNGAHLSPEALVLLSAR